MIPNGKAAIYLYCSDRSLKIIDFVQINDQNVFDLPLLPDSYMIYLANPGKCKINTMLGPKPGELILNVAEGESYYVKVKSISKVFFCSSKLYLSTPEIAIKEITKCNYRPNVFISEKYRTIALVSTTITEPELPELPAINAKLFNSYVRKIWNRIVEIEKTNLGIIRETAAKQLKTYFNATILWGDSLNKMPEVIELKKKYNFTPTAYMKNGTPYPPIISDSCDLQLYPEIHGKTYENKNSPIYFLAPLKEIAHKVNADMIVAINFYFSLDFPAYSSIIELYINASVVMMTPEGNIISRDNETICVADGISGDNEYDFQVAASEFPMVFGYMLEKITANLAEKTEK